MAGLSDILAIARSALLANRAAMNTVGHNIANAGTLGFSRQRVELAAAIPLRQSFGSLGRGVEVQSIIRVRERFIDTQIRSSNDIATKAETQQKILSQMEAIINEPSDTGIDALMTNFFNSFQNLALHPEDSAFRTNVLQQADFLTQSFQQLNKNLSLLRNDVTSNVGGTVKEINSLADQISELDKKITEEASFGVIPNDLLDQRDLAIDKLSKLASINVSEDLYGSVMVSISGVVVASKSGSMHLSAKIQGNQIVVVSEDSQQAVRIQSGELGGSLDMYNNIIPKYIQNIDNLAVTLITNVNAVHRIGFGVGSPAPTGNDFFSGTSAANIVVNTTVTNNPNLIAASQDGTVGDNRNALALSDLRNTMLMNNNSLTMSQFYGNFVSELGTTINTTNNTQQTQTLVLQQLEAHRDSVSGVSIDEEMTNMIKFQRAFEASARMVSTVDGMFQTILNMVQ